MMNTKDVEIKGKRYQISEIDPVVGTRVINNLFAAMAGVETKEGSSDAKDAFDELTPEEKAEVSVQSMWVMAANTLPTAKYAEIQKEALRCCRMYQGEDLSTPIPILMANGQWAVEKPGIVAVSELILKALQFNLAPFFNESASS